jgi:hypothetical protein
LGKHTRFSFSSSSSRAEKTFDLLHLDLLTSSVISVSGSKYYLVILDDFTHYLWTFLLKQKSDTFTTLSIFFAYVATQFSCTAKSIQYDNRREFENSSTRTFLLSKGAQLWMSYPYTSPQNGKAERIIRTINSVICTLLIQASLPGHYWVEGLHTAVYLLNHLPTKMISVACPHVTLFGSAPRTSTSASLVMHVILISPPPHPISSPLDPLDVSPWATLPITKAIAALISQQTA